MKTFINCLPKPDQEMPEQLDEIADILEYLLSNLTAEEISSPFRKGDIYPWNEPSGIILYQSEMQEIANFISKHGANYTKEHLVNMQEDQKHEEYKDSFGIEDYV